MASRTSDLDLQSVADGALILSHRLAEWISRGPTMEEDVALGNIGLDLLGQARGLLQYLGSLEGTDEDQLAYFREASQFRNPMLVEVENGDFGHTMLRQLFADAWFAGVWEELAGNPSYDEQVRGVAEKALKENAYHLRHSSAWVVRLGDGTEESHARMLASLDALWPLRAQVADEKWYAVVEPVLTEATLPVPARDAWTLPGPHTEALSYLLAEMQSLARAHPGATW